jgi:recombination protein RecA
MSVKRLKARLLKKTKVQSSRIAVPRSHLLSTGSTLLNLACTGKYYGGFVRGKYHLIVGDSASGKTFLSLTCLAEASRNSNFDEYNFVLDDIEGGMMFDISQLFGIRLQKRLKIEHSRTLEEMYYTIDNYLKKDEPFIYIVDSMDSLDTEEDEEKFQKQKKAHSKGTVVAGSYGTSKAKMNSSNLRRLMTPLRDSKSILIMISQTRDNLGFGFSTKTRAGGRALRFYSALEIWSSITGKIKKKIEGKDRVIGIKAKIDIKKNRVTGQDRNIEIPIYYSYGIDDIGSCIQFLVDEGHWKKSGRNIRAPELGHNGTMEQLAEKVEVSATYLLTLQQIVGNVWYAIEQQCRLDRKPKYG